MGRKRRARDGPDGVPSDMEDEIDTFANAKDKVTLNVSDGEGEGDTSEEEAILDLHDSSDEEEEEEEESMDEDDGSGEESDLEEIGLDELEKDIQEGGEIGELAEQAKAARQMLMKAKGADDSSSGEEEEEGDEKAPVMQWGGARQFYGTADGREADMGDEELEEEAEEVLKLQKQQLRSLDEKDFDLGASDDGDSEEDAEEEGADPKAEAAASGPKEVGGPVDPEKMAMLIKQSPELVALCADLKESLTELRTKIGPLVKEAREGGLCENEGLSYLEVKHHLLLHYCICIMFYLLMKVEGKPVKDHPVILRLIEIRAFLEKIRPIDARLQYQVEKVLRAAQMAKNAENGEENAQEEEDALQFAPRPDALITEGDLELENGDGIYKAPKLNPVAMEEDMEAANEQRRRVEERKRAAQSDLVNEMVQELTGAPEEVRDHKPGWDTAKAIRALKKMEERSKMEEEMFTRVAFTKAEKKRFKAHKHRAGMAGGMVMSDFADDVRHTLNAIEGTRSSQHFDTNTIPQRGRPKSGDADLPMKDSFKERKKLFDQIKMRKMEKFGRRSAPTEQEEEAQMAARQAKQEKVARIQAEKEKRRQTKPPSAVPTVDGPRGISNEIQKNRGLTPHRRRDIKNPRKRQRLRYETAKTKRSGAVQKQREDKDHYGGEATGIKKNIAKSVRFR
ncbi:hypothetical protein BSKO_08134 [Bryopsis sp. KO-2023]|nr:hypothetical protein BSKO_08134 [Bryopsis sp. KO-2023]